MARMTLLYFASLRERAGLERELVDSAARTLAELYRCFGEGFDTPDLRDARTLLAALGEPDDGA